MPCRGQTLPYTPPGLGSHAGSVALSGHADVCNRLPYCGSVVCEFCGTPGWSPVSLREPSSGGGGFGCTDPRNALDGGHGHRTKALTQTPASASSMQQGSLSESEGLCESRQG